MRTEPCQAAPTHTPPTVPTRRVFLWSCGTFAAGAGLGVASGYVAAVLRRGQHRAPAPDDDAELAELHRLATTAPIAELMASAVVFLDLLRERYPDDAILWSGAERIADALLHDPHAGDRDKLSRWLLQVVEQGDPQRTADLRRRVRQLRGVQ